MLSHYVQMRARLFGSMRALPHAYLVGSFLSEPPSTCTAFMCARTQQWRASKCSDETVRLPMLFRGIDAPI